MARTKYCIEAITSKWTDKGPAIWRSWPKDEHFGHYFLEGALMARFEDSKLKIHMVSSK